MAFNSKCSLRADRRVPDRILLRAGARNDSRRTPFKPPGTGDPCGLPLHAGPRREHVFPTFKERRVGAITPADVQGLVHGWSERMAASTVWRAYSTLRAVFSYAVADDLIVRSPCRGIKRPSVGAVRCHVVTGDELAALGDALGDDGPMAYLGAVLGLRWGEIAGLRVGRLNSLRSTVRVEEQRTRGNRGRMVVASPKSEAGRRTLGVPGWLMEMLSAHLARRGLTGADADELVFVAPRAGR